MEALEIDARNKTERRPRVFIPGDIGKVFSAGFLDELRCRDLILTEIHGHGERYCPECRIPLTGVALQRFGEGKRICCHACGKYFTALTGTFLGGCHMDFREIILLAVFLHFDIPAREIARILKISPETVRLWEIKFRSLDRIREISVCDPEIDVCDPEIDVCDPEIDSTDDLCHCGDPDCSRPFGHAEETPHA